MKTFVVKVPFTGFYEVTVEAETKKDAEQKAIKANVDFSNNETYDHYEWEAHPIIIDGHIGRVLQNEIEVVEMK